MESRFASGDMTHRDGYTVNIYGILTRLVSDMPDHAAGIPLPTSLAGKKPNLDQRAMIIDTLKSRSDKKDDVNSGYTNALGNLTIYTTHVDRLRFHGMLKQHLGTARLALQKLKAHVNDVANRDEEVFKKRVKAVWRCMSKLLQFLDLFKEYIEPHVEWLAECANVTDFKDTPTWTAPSRTTPAPTPVSQPQDIRDANDADPYTGVDNLASVQDSVPYDATRPYRAFAVTAHAYMRRPCLHSICLNRAAGGEPGKKTTSQKYESALVTQAKIGVLHFEIPKWDNTITPIDQAFFEKTLEGYNAGLKWKTLVDNLDDKNAIGVSSMIQKTSPTVSGAPHCESLLWSVLACLQDPEIMQHMTQQWLEHNGIFAAAEDLFEMLHFKNPAAVIFTYCPDSKKCCPPCGILRYQMGFVAPGGHNKYSGVMLPKTLPRAQGLPVLQKIKATLGEKLLQWQQKLEITRTDLDKQKDSPMTEENQDSPDRYVLLLSPRSYYHQASALADDPARSFPHRFEILPSPSIHPLTLLI